MHVQHLATVGPAIRSIPAGAALLLGCACNLGGPRDKSATIDTSPDTAQAGLPEDADGDGYSADQDCDDADANRHPEAEERCNGLDDNCDGSIDEELAGWLDEDGDGWGGATAATCANGEAGVVAQGGDCADTDPGRHPGAAEVPCDEIDQDCDGQVPEMVSVEGGPMWSSLSAAVTDTEDGDVLLVCDGIWTEEFELSNGQVRTVRSRSGDRSAVIFDGEGLHSLFRVTNNAALTLEQMTLRNAVGQFLWERDHGGAVSLVNATLTVHGVDFLDNLASDNHGGAIGAFVGGDDRADPYVTLVITDSTFVGNQAQEGGGAIAITGGNFDAESPVVVSIDGSTFLNNSAQNWAGDLGDDTFNSYNEWTIRDTTFTGSTCVDGSASMGVVLWGAGRLTLERVRFDTLLSSDTSASPAVLFYGDEVEADLSDVSVQHATTTGGGHGAIVISGQRNHARLTDVSIFDAWSAQGGALVVTGGSDLQAELSGISITQTETMACGDGALAVAGHSSSSAAILQDIVLEQIVGAGPSCAQFSALHLAGDMSVTASNLDFGQGERANRPLDLRIEPSTAGGGTTDVDLGADIGLDCPTLETCTVLRP